MSKSKEQWILEYSQSHQHKTNQLLHKICVPVIFWTVTAFLFLLKVKTFPIGLVFAFLTLFFYYRLGWKTGLAMNITIFLCFTLCYWVQKLTGRLLEISVILFVVAWIGQFIGHKIEGKKPSFFEDLQFLLIGPLWITKK